MGEGGKHRQCNGGSDVSVGVDEKTLCRPVGERVTVRDDFEKLGILGSESSISEAFIFGAKLISNQSVFDDARVARGL